jgi:hypothetical protein
MEIWKTFKEDFLMSNTGFVISTLTDSFLVPTTTSTGALRITHKQKSLYLRKIAYELYGVDVLIITDPEQIRLRNLTNSLNVGLEGEDWREVADFYLVSDYGRVINLETGLLKTGAVDGYGYLKTKVYFGGVAVQTGIHRLVATGFLSNLNNLPQVNHIDGNKLNNNLHNLEWVTALENMHHAEKSGLRESCPTKLTAIQIPMIKEMARLGDSNYSIGKKFGVDPSTIRCVINGTSWRHIR